jgi:hypothetical protein
MKIMRSVLAGALAVTLATACSDSTAPSDVTAADLVGTWDASSVVFTPDAGGTAVDVVLLGFGFEITFNAEGGYTATTQVPLEDPDIEIGTFTVANGVITLSPVGEDAETLRIDSFSGSMLVVTDTNAEYDFDGDDVEEDANMTATLVKE